MAVVSRLQLNHPALGTTGGATLHTSIEALYKKLGDAMADRYFALTDFDNGETVDLLHNFDTDIANLRYDLYNYTGGQWVEVTTTSSPALSAFTIIEKAGFEDLTLQITNVSGGNDLEMAIVLVNDPIRLLGNDIKDVDNTVPIEDGQSFVYDATIAKMKAGASGDSSFKVQTVATPNATIKGGFLIDDAGRELATFNGSLYGADITVNLTTVLGSAPANATTYYLYVDRLALAAAVTEAATGRVLYAVAQAQLFLSTTTPLSIDRSRYYPIGLIRSATTGTVWSGAGSTFKNLAVRRHQVPSVNVSPMVQTILEDRSMGEVGSVDDGYGALTSSVFTTFGIGASAFSFYPLDNSALDGSGNTRTLTNTGVNFTGKGFFGRETILSSVISTNNLKRTGESFFNVNLSSANWSMGVWAYLPDWSANSAQAPIHIGDNTNYLLIQKTSSVVRVLSNTGNIQTNAVAQFTPGWHHLALTVSSGVGKFFVDGQLAGTSGGFTSNITASIGVIGNANDGSTPWAGLLQDAFFTSALITESQMLELASKRFSGAQVSAGHHLDADSFPVSLSGKVSAWNFQTTSNDLPVNAKNLSSGTQPVYTGLGLFGAADAAVFNGTTTAPFLVDSFFTPGNGRSVAIGGWFAADDWTPPGAQYLFSIWPSSADRVLYCAITPTIFQLSGTNTAGADSFQISNTRNTQLVDGSWHHVVWYFDFQAQLLKLAVDGVFIDSVAMTNLRPATSARLLFGGLDSPVSNFFKGRMADCFFARDVQLSDADILKLYSARLDLVGASANVRLADRILQAKFQSEDGKTYNDFDQSWLLDQKSNKVYVNFGNGDAKVTLKCFDGGLSASVLPVRSYDVTFTATPGATIAHGLPGTPTSFAVLHNELADGKYVPLNAENYLKADATNIYTAGFGSLVIDATRQLRIVAAVGQPSIAFARDFSENLTPLFITKTGAYTASAGDQILADTTSAAFTITLPATPVAGVTRVTIFDSKKTFDTNNLTVARNGLNIEGAAADLTLNVEGTKAELIYIDATVGWRLYANN